MGFGHMTLTGTDRGPSITGSKWRNNFVSAFAIVTTVVVIGAVGCSGPSRTAKARQLFELGATEEASDLISEELRENPSNEEAHYVRLLFKDLADETAPEEMSKLVKRSPSIRALALKEFAAYLPTLPDSEEVQFTADAYRNFEPEEGAPDPDEPDEPAIARFAVSLAPLYLHEHPEALKDELTAYRLLNNLSAGRDRSELGAVEDQFTSLFPMSNRTLAILWRRGSERYTTDRHASWMMLGQISQQFPDTQAARTARLLQKDWWSLYEIRLPVEAIWMRVASLKRGDKFRFIDMEELRFEMGAYGTEVIGINQLTIYQGPIRTNEESQKTDLSSWGGKKPDLTGYRGSISLHTEYEATGDGYLWIKVGDSRNFGGRTLRVTVEVQNL